MENDKFDLTEPYSAEEARADNLSGLPDVFTQCGGGADIQPLEDIKPEEMQPFEDCKITLPEKKTAPEKEKSQKIKKLFIRAAIVAVILCLAAASGYYVFLRFNDYAHPAVAIYQKGSKTEVLLDNDKTFELENVVEAKLSDDGCFLAYSQNSKSKTGKFDVRIVELKKRSSVKEKGSLAVSGADEGWSVSGDCSYVYYSVTEGKAKKYYVYLTASKKSEAVASDAQEVFMPPGGDVIYFTRKSGKDIKLFKSRIGENASEISTVSGAKAFTDGRILEVFYTVVNEDSTYKLYKISQDAAPVEIAADISEVYLDDYSVGGNLYYFVKSESKFNWQDFIYDEYADEDAAMSEPDKKDYTYTVGFIFKREKLDESAYNLALDEYHQKVIRDSIRQALNNVDIKDALLSQYKVKVYDGEKSRELAGGIAFDDLKAYSKTGMPRIIVKKSSVGTGKKISMDELYKTAVQNSTELATDYALQALKNSDYEISDGYKYCYCNNGNVYEYDYNFSSQYITTEATFLFGGKNSIFAAVKSDKTHYNLYYSVVKDGSITKEKLVSENVVSFDSCGEKIYAAVSQTGVSKELYVCAGDGSCKCICKNFIEKYFNGDAVIMLRTKTETPNIEDVEIVVYKESGLTNVDGGVYGKNVIFKNDKIAYIKNYEVSDEGADYGGKMYIYEIDKNFKIDDDVKRIYDIH